MYTAESSREDVKKGLSEAPVNMVLEQQHLRHIHLNSDEILRVNTWCDHLKEQLRTLELSFSQETTLSKSLIRTFSGDSLKPKNLSVDGLNLSDLLTQWRECEGQLCPLRLEALSLRSSDLGDEYAFINAFFDFSSLTTFALYSCRNHEDFIARLARVCST